MQLSKKLKTFFPFFSPNLKFASNFKHLEKKMTRTAYVFLKLQTVNNMVRHMFE